MNKFKILLAALIAAALAFTAAPSVANDEDTGDTIVVVGNEPIIQWHGQDLGKVGASREFAIARDRECDGNPVNIELYPKPDHPDPFLAKSFTDDNGCQTGGGRMTVPNWARRARTCETDWDNREEPVTCTPFSALSEW